MAKSDLVKSRRSSTWSSRSDATAVSLGCSGVPARRSNRVSSWLRNCSSPAKDLLGSLIYFAKLTDCDGYGVLTLKTELNIETSDKSSKVRPLIRMEDLFWNIRWEQCAKIFPLQIHTCQPKLFSSKTLTQNQKQVQGSPEILTFSAIFLSVIQMKKRGY